MDETSLGSEQERSQFQAFCHFMETLFQYVEKRKNILSLVATWNQNNLRIWQKKKSDLSKAFRRYIFKSVEKFTEAMVQLDFLGHRNAKESAEKEHYYQPRISSSLTIWESCGEKIIAWKGVDFYPLGKR